MYEQKGTVYLVGAGPGDPKLLTLKATELLQIAEVIVYDRLIGHGVLNFCNPKAEYIDVGKNSGNHPVPQNEINKILLNKALENKIVVRLKGGDSFLFGRGGEELELLAEHGVPFQVIPGVTSAIAAPAYAGIPVTHRKFCSSLHIITGHTKTDSALDYAAPAQLGGTLVFMMSVAKIGEISRGLVASGMSPETHCALVENGTHSNQRSFLATLQTAEQTAAENNVTSPAVFVVGEVCTYMTDFNWFETLPLKGAKVLVTRPKTVAGKLSAELNALGANAVEYPCIKTVSMPFRAKLEDYNVITFTSAVGVNIFFDWLYAQGMDGRSLYNKKIAAIGSETAKAVKQYGINPDIVPETYDCIHLGELLKDENNIGLFRAKNGSQELVAILEKHNRNFTDIPVYETQYIKNPELTLTDYDYVTFTSASCVTGFVNSVGDRDFSGLPAICIGKQTAAEAEKYGFKTHISDRATITSLRDKLVEVHKNGA